MQYFHHETHYINVMFFFKEEHFITTESFFAFFSDEDQFSIGLHKPKRDTFSHFIPVHVF